jgi:rhodanese-related sulfurtransferase
MSEHFRSIDANELQEIMTEGKIPLIDVRRQDEFDFYGIIEGSHKMTFFDEMGQHDANGWLEKLDTLIDSKNDPFVLICAHANRTKVIGQFLNEMGFTNVMELDGGINYGWRDLGLQTVKD